MSVSGMSQKDFPRYLKLPDGTTVVAFDMEQLEAIQRVLILWDNLEFKNYELEKKVAKQDTLIAAKDKLIDRKNIDIAKLEYQERISSGLYEQFKALYEEQKAETQKWSVKYNKEVTKKKWWRRVAIIEAGIIGIETVVITLLLKS